MANILVAEDSPTQTEVIRSILQTSGHDVTCVTDGRLAIETLQRTPFDLVVSDLNMPNMDGRELTETLAKTMPQIPVVVVTVRGSESLAVDALAIGAIDFVPKDSMHSLLCPVVDHVLAYRRADESASKLQGQLRAPEFYFKLVSDTQSIETVACYLVATMAAAKCGTPNDRYRCATAVASAVFNAMRYGNREGNDPTEACDLHVRVKVSIAETDTRISIAHEGRGRMTRSTPAPGTPESFEIEQCRGLMLMSSFMDDVIFNKRRSEVILVKRHAPVPAIQATVS